MTGPGSKRYRIIIILLVALLLVYGSQAVVFYYGLNKRTTAGEVILFLFGAILYLFCDMMMQNDEKRYTIFKSEDVIWPGMALVFTHSMVKYFLEVDVMWFILAIYSIYFVYLSVKVHRMKPMAGND